MQAAPTLVVTLRQCIQDARRLLEVFEDHGIDETGLGEPQDREALMTACGRDLASLLRRIGGLSTARLAASLEAPPAPQAEVPRAEPRAHEASPPAPAQEVAQVSGGAADAAPDKAEDATADKGDATADKGDATADKGDATADKGDASADKGDASSGGAGPDGSLDKGGETGELAEEAAEDAQPGGDTAAASPHRVVPLKERQTKTVTDFRDATEEECRLFPMVWSFFDSWLDRSQAKMAENTRRSYSAAVWSMFRFDAKSPEEMATEEYRIAVKGTLEDRTCSSLHSSAMRRFGQFWKEESGSFPAYEDWLAQQTDEVRARLEKMDHGKRLTRLRIEESGDGSEEARKAHGLDLPEGWRVHHSAAGRVLGWSSPEGVFYWVRSEVLQIVQPPRPKLTTPVGKGKKRSAEEARLGEGEEGDQITPDKAPRPLAELLADAADVDAATQQDRSVLPRVLSTFARHLGEQKTDRQRQSTRDSYVLCVFKLFTQCGRSLNAMAQPQFMELMAQSEEVRKNRALSTALRAFQKFWAEVGGYGGKFDEADRDSLNLAMNVRPSFADAPGECCAFLPGGRACSRPNLQCVTCGCRLKCEVHGEHSVQECRDIFWAKHSRQGTRLRTMADFLKPSAPAPAEAAAPAEAPSDLAAAGA